MIDSKNRFYQPT